MATGTRVAKARSSRSDCPRRPRPRSLEARDERPERPRCLRSISSVRGRSEVTGRKRSPPRQVVRRRRIVLPSPLKVRRSAIGTTRARDPFRVVSRRERGTRAAPISPGLDGALLICRARTPLSLVGHRSRDAYPLEQASAVPIDLRRRRRAVERTPVLDSCRCGESACRAALATETIPINAAPPKPPSSGGRLVGRRRSSCPTAAAPSRDLHERLLPAPFGPTSVNLAARDRQRPAAPVTARAFPAYERYESPAPRRLADAILPAATPCPGSCSQVLHRRRLASSPHCPAWASAEVRLLQIVGAALLMPGVTYSVA